MENNEHGDLKIIKEWISKQQHLPQNIHDTLLMRFLHVCNNSIEQTKSLIDLFYTLRSQAPEIFDNRDPTQPHIQHVFENLDLIPLPKLTEDKCKVFVYRTLSDDPDKYDFVNWVKAFFLFSDVRMIDDDDLSDEGEILVFDMNNYTLRHLTKIVPSVVKKYMVYSQEAHPVKLKQIHLLNAPSFFDRIMAIMRPFLKSEVAKSIHFHVSNSETLFDYVPKDVLPEEYGGTGGKIPDIKKIWCDKVMKNRNYLIDDSRWKLREHERPVENADKKELFGMNGSFRALSID